MQKAVLRIISLVMLIVAIVFLSVALTHPELESVFYIGTLAIGSSVWRVFYCLYALVMIGLFAASFFIKTKNNDTRS